MVMGRIDLLKLDTLVKEYHRNNLPYEFIGYRFLKAGEVVIYSEEICRVYGKVTVHSNNIKMSDLCTTQE